MGLLSKQRFGSAVIRDYLRDSRGSISTMLGLSILPLFVAAGAAIDTARVAREEAAFSGAVDSAALAIAASNRSNLGGLSDAEKDARIAELKTFAAAYITENYTPQFHDDTEINTTLDITETTVTLAASHDYPTTIMKITGITELTVDAFSEVTKAGSSFEVALVLDNTGSMAGSRIDSLKTAASDFVDTVVATNQTPYYSKVAIVPYSMGVNVGTFAEAARGSVLSGTNPTRGVQPPAHTNFWFRNQNGNDRTYAISTCVSERIGTEAYTDAAVSAAPVGRVYPPSTSPCLSSKIEPLTSNKTTLKNNINAMTAVGSTAGQVGVAWGWYTLSPNIGLWSGDSVPAAYDVDDVKKIMVLMTDGEYNTNYCKGVRSQSSTSGSGSTDTHINCNGPNGSPYTQAEELCKQMKLKGVVVYTIEFELIDTTAARNLVKNCASGSSFQFKASDSAGLQAAFQGIAKNLLALRLSK